MGEFSPPPYEVVAYPMVKPRRRLRGIFSLRTLLVAALTSTLTVLYFALHPRHFRHEPPVGARSTATHLRRFDDAVRACKALYHLPGTPAPGSRRENPRWNPQRGQQEKTVLGNVTLFDGEKVLPRAMDVVFEKGIITSVSETSRSSWVGWEGDGVKVENLYGRFVTPGLVDMHSHHCITGWPDVGLNDGNEMHPSTGPLTPMVRAIDSMTARDMAIRVIMSGGVTSSLIIPGSANIMGGEGVPVKNVERSGPNGEYVVEELLLEHGVPAEDRRRYIKLACGENPARVYGHTRMANAWILRHQMERAAALMERQDGYCEGVEDVVGGSEADRVRFVAERGAMPNELEMDSTVGLLRGRVLMQNHCYEPRDFETMLRVSHEFGFRVRAFHHATEAWQVPEMLKEYGDNVTIAIFAEFSLYKWEAYFPSLYAGAKLDARGIPVAYKSDHSSEMTNAKYLMSQAGVAHNCFLPAEKALQAVTSVPAKALDLDFRVGYARQGYDADLVVWDAHPLSVAATPMQVFVDGVAQLEPEKVKESMGAAFVESQSALPPKEPAMRSEPEEEARGAFCTGARQGGNFVVTGITKAVLGRYPELQAGIQQAGDEALMLVIEDGAVSCLGAESSCSEAAGALTDNRPVTRLNLTNGYLTPGLVALSYSLGMNEVAMQGETGDGFVPPLIDAANPSIMPFAKYGVHLEGKAMALARMGGITRAISPPSVDLGSGGGFVTGVSVGIVTDGNSTLLDGGIFKGDVALHLALGGRARLGEGTVSNAVKKLRTILGGEKRDGVWGRIVDGELPLLIEANNKYEIQQLILVKKDYPSINLVIQGGAEAPYVAKELAEASIPMILTENRPAPWTFMVKDAVVGPPLSRSVASYLRSAGVRFAIGFVSFADSQIQDLALEAAWAAKYTGMSIEEALTLVSKEVEDILQLEPSRDMVLWEGNPLEFGGTVALALGDRKGKLTVVSCWPTEDE